jgi:hypothetical protein
VWLDADEVARRLLPGDVERSSLPCNDTAGTLVAWKERSRYPHIFPLSGVLMTHRGPRGGVWKLST